MTIGRLFLAVVAVVSLSIVVGCGDDDDSAGAGGANGGQEITVEAGSLSKPEFVKRADKLCKEARARYKRDFDDFVGSDIPTPASPLKPSKAAKLVDTVLVPHFRKLVDQINALGAPKGDEGKVAAFLNTLQQRLDQAEAQPAKFIKELSPLSAAVRKARTYGLVGCAYNLS